MARLAGISQNGGGQSGNLLRRMLTAMGTGEAVDLRVGDGATFGVSGTDGGIFESETHLVALDGTIYNRDEFGASASAKPRSDAEAVCLEIAQFGVESALHKLNGDFAVIAYDKASQRLFAARDRFGVKPLYYAMLDGALGLASRPAGLLKDGFGLKPSANRRWVGVFAASHYSFIDNRPAESPFNGVSQLPSGHILSWRSGELAVRIQRYWTPSADDDLRVAQDEVGEAYLELFLDAVKRRVRSAERPAFTLSGGLDSSSVLCAAAKTDGRTHEAFSTLFTDDTYDETEEIADVAGLESVSWSGLRIDDPDLFDLSAKLIRMHDEPVATVTWLTHLLLAEKVKDLGHDALFGGLGGDEQHAGEFDYFFYFFADLLRAGETDRLETEIERWIAYHDHPIFRKGRDLALRKAAELTEAGSCGRNRPDMALYRQYETALNPDYFSLDDFRPESYNPVDAHLHNHTLHELLQGTMPCCLRATDRNSEAVGLRSSLPFFDHRLVDFTLKVKASDKIRDGVTKQLLRRAMKGILPEATRRRVAKTGWNAPAHRWFVSTMREPLQDIIHSSAFRGRGIYREAEVKRLAEEHFRIVEQGLPIDNHMKFLWQLINLELWFQAYDL